MLRHVVDHLACPYGEPSLALDGPSLVCPAGHRFDVARQGYVSLLRGRPPAAADTAQMVAARVEVVGGGHLAPLTTALVEAVVGAEHPADSGGAAGVGDRTGSVALPGLVVDVGAGPGHHLAAVLEATGAPAGLALDSSKAASRRAARAHPRLGAVLADAWQPLPIRDAAAHVVLVVFAPRNLDEILRILTPGGRLVVVTPEPDHLGVLVERLGLLRVDAGKPDALDLALAGRAEPVGRRLLRWTRRLTHAEVAAVVAMGPSAHHLDIEVVTERIAGLPEPVEVGFAVTVSVARRC